MDCKQNDTQINTQEEITRIGNPRKPQGEEGEQMLDRMNQSHYEMTGWGLSHISFAESAEVLDIGCGGGATLKRISEQIKTGHLNGIDYSAVSVKKSQELNDEAVKAGNMQILEASVEALPFTSAFFDKIVTVESFYFWPNPAENLKEVFRVLKPGGTFALIAEIYGKEDLSEQLKADIARMQLFNPTKEEFQQIFTAAGFTNVQIYTQPGEDWICVTGER